MEISISNKVRWNLETKMNNLEITNSGRQLILEITVVRIASFLKGEITLVRSALVLKIRVPIRSTLVL